MISLSLEKPVKINIKTPKGLEPEFEIVGRLIDNIIVMAHNQKLDLKEEGKEFKCEFVVGKKNKYSAKFAVGKTQYTLLIEYIKELTKYEATRTFAVPPKDKMMLEEAEKQAREQVKEKKKKETTKKKGKVSKDEFKDLE